MSNEPEKMSINVFTTNKDSIMKSENSSTEFIIKQNEEYNNSNVKLRIELVQLRTDMERLEDDNDKQGTSIRYMRGMLKNYVELKGLYKSIVESREKLAKIDAKELKMYDKYCIDQGLCIMFFIFLFIMNNLVFVYMGVMPLRVLMKMMLSVVICGSVSCQYYGLNEQMKNMGKDYNFVKNVVEGIDESLVKIKKIESSSDFLSEYIDSL